MTLLYCDASGQVVAWHDAAAAAVPLSVYHTAIRIIPYPDGVATLDRVGAPIDGMPVWADPRPYAQPTETSELLIAYAGQVRYEQATAGIDFNAASGTIPVACDRESQMLVGNLMQYAATVPGTTQIDFTQAGVHYPLLASEVPTMFNDMMAFIQQVRTIEAQCIADQNLATPTMTTYDEIDAKFATVSLPQVTGLSPATGPLAGSTSVMVTGRFFTGATSVKFGGTAATSFTVNSDNSITVVSPAGTGVVDVIVFTPAGASAARSDDQFTYAAAPTVTALSPTTGTVNGGDSVTITGTGFTGATAVNFGATQATSFIVNSDTSISAVSPAVAASTVDVTVVSPGGTSATSAADQFTFA